MRPHACRYFGRSLVGASMSLALAGCVGRAERYPVPTADTAILANTTPYSDALACLKSYAARRPLRIAVGPIVDYTGRLDSEDAGLEPTQGVALMAVSALARAGVPLVERLDTSVEEMELEYA